MVTRDEVNRHASASSCWIIIGEIVYDMTGFIHEHPGGKSAILREAGNDATEAFDAVHSREMLVKYKAQLPVLGTIPRIEEIKVQEEVKDELKTSTLTRRRLRRIINLDEFEKAAEEVLPAKYFAFFKTGADSEVATRWNKRSWAAIRFRPRVLVPVSNINLSTSILGTSFSAPFFIAPASGGKFSNRQGEVLLTRTAARHGILQWVCNNAGCTQKELADARAEKQTLYWQIYAMKDLEITRKEVEQAVASGYRGFALTVDAIHVGKRERDMRMNIVEENSEEPRLGDESPAMSISVSRPACYELFDFGSAIEWLRSITDLPIAIKGIQSWEDAQLCMHYGVHPWLSNHGGRQLDSAPSAAETLLELRQHCPQVFESCEVIVDGGITRGADIVKALALGAKGVAVGRSFLYALVFGEEGLDKAIRMLKQEIEATMGLLGISSLAELRPSHVDALGLAMAGAVTRARL